MRPPRPVTSTTEPSSDTPDVVPTSTAAESQPIEEALRTSSGRVTFDSRGNSVWEWNTESASTTAPLTIEIPGTTPSELSLEDNSLPGGGFNPYNNGVPKAPIRPDAATNEGSAIPKKKTMHDLRKLGEWLAMKKRLEDSKDDE
jgi:hypothetical protein